MPVKESRTPREAAGVPCTVVAIETAPAAKLERIARVGRDARALPYAVAWQALDDRSYPGVSGTVYPSIRRSELHRRSRDDGPRDSRRCADTAAIIAGDRRWRVITGIASAVKALRSRVKVWGAEPETAAPARSRFAKGSAQGVPGLESTFVDGAGGKSVFPRMWQRMQPVVDGYIVCELDEVKRAMRLMAEKARVIAGSGALGLAAALTGKAGKGRWSPLSRAATSISRSSPKDRRGSVTIRPAPPPPCGA